MGHFLHTYFSNLRFADLCFKKGLFSYSYLNKLLDSAGEFQGEAISHLIPSIDNFQNDLNEGKLPSRQSYDDMLSVHDSMGLKTYGDSLFLYNALDISLLITSLNCLDGFFFREFGLSLLNYTSISRYAFDVNMKSVAERRSVNSQAGVELISNEEQRDFLQGSVFGGISHTKFTGGSLKPFNSPELPHFDPSTPQTKGLSLDVNSLFVFIMATCPMPVSRYHLHNQSDSLVQRLNEILEAEGSKGLVDYCLDKAKNEMAYFLFEVDILYSEQSKE